MRRKQSSTDIRLARRRAIKPWSPASVMAKIRSACAGVELDSRFCPYSSDKDHLTSAREAVMSLTKPNRQLRSELIDLGCSLEQTASDVLCITKYCKDIDVKAVPRLIAKLYEDADRLKALADEIRDGKVTRVKPE